MMGKPTTADLRLGLATAPVLFAAQHHPDLNPLIMRRFSKTGDVEKARKLVEKVQGSPFYPRYEFIGCNKRCMGKKKLIFCTF